MIAARLWAPGCRLASFCVADSLRGLEQLPRCLGWLTPRAPPEAADDGNGPRGPGGRLRRRRPSSGLRNLSQTELVRVVRSSQSRVAKMESGDPSVLT